MQARCKLKKRSHCNLWALPWPPGSGLDEPQGCHTAPGLSPTMQSRAHITQKRVLFPQFQEESWDLTQSPASWLATKENIDVIQRATRNPNLAQWSFWLCFRFQQLCSALCSGVGCIHRGHAVCAGSTFFPCAKNTSPQHMNQQTSAGWSPLTQCNSSACSFCPITPKRSPKSHLRMPGLITELWWVSAVGAGRHKEKPAPSTEIAVTKLLHPACF